MSRRSAANCTPSNPCDDHKITTARMTLIRNLVFAASPDDIFAAIADLGAIPEWIPAIRAAEVLTPGPLRAGSRFVQHAHFLFCAFPIEGRLTAFRPSREIAYRYSRGVVAGDWRYRISPAPSGTRLEICIYLTGSALLRPVVTWVVGRNIARFARWAAARAKARTAAAAGTAAAIQ